MSVATRFSARQRKVIAILQREGPQSLVRLSRVHKIGLGSIHDHIGQLRAAGLLEEDDHGILRLTDEGTAFDIEADLPSPPAMPQPEPIDNRELPSKLTPELRQVISILRREGSLSLRVIARQHHIDRGKLQDRAWQLCSLGLIYKTSPDVLHLTNQGRKVQLNPSNDRIENPHHDAGFTERQIKLAEQRLNGHAATPDAASPDPPAIREYKHLVPTDVSQGFETDPHIPELPADFVELAVAKVAEQIKVGNFSALHTLAGSLAHQWEVRQIADSPLASRPLGQRLMMHLSECRDVKGKLICVRVLNAVEIVCPATLGAIREHWPMGFRNTPNTGETFIKTLGMALVAAALITPEEYLNGIERYGKVYRSAKFAIGSDDDEVESPSQFEE